MEDLSHPGAGLFSPAASGPHPSWWRGEGVFRWVRAGSFIERLSVCQALGGWEFQVSPTALSFKVNQRETLTHPPTSFAPFLCMQPWTFQSPAPAGSDPRPPNPCWPPQRAAFLTLELPVSPDHTTTVFPTALACPLQTSQKQQ